MRGGRAPPAPTPAAPFPLPTACLGSHSKSCPTRRKFPASGPDPICYHFPSHLLLFRTPPGVGAVPFCSSSPPYSRVRSTPKVVPCSQSKCARWVRREIPQMSTGVCPWPHCSPRAVLHLWWQRGRRVSAPQGASGHVPHQCEDPYWEPNPV